MALSLKSLASRGFDVKAWWAKWPALRQSARNDELFLILLAVVAGAVAAVGVIALRELVVLFHHYLYGVPAVEHALQGAVLQWWRPVAILGAGGVAYGLVAMLIRRWRPIDPMDVIEANALHGGNLPLWDGLIIAFLTVTAVGLGASVGLEAGVTQLGAAAASWMGRRCKMNRTAMRTLVGCGAAAAIAAAFNAPIAGIFYALELVIGGYAVTALIPVAVAGITGTLTAHLMFDVDPIYFIVTPPMLNSADYGLFALLGVAAAAIGVIVMRLATTVEAILKRAHIPNWLRPGIGGLALAAIGYSYPQVLGSGHGALDATLNGDVAVQLLLALLAAKALASAISIGSGFRGGLFSASLLLGSLLGSAYWSICFYLFPTHVAVHSAYAVVGIGAVAASVIGAPLTMILLVFETTSDYTMTVGVAVGVMVATVVTRRLFGFSFSTWRFHLRGVPLKGAFDVGRMYDMTVRRILDRDVLTLSATARLDAVVHALLSARQPLAFVQREDGAFVGIVDSKEVQAKLKEEGRQDITAEAIAHAQAHLLTPDDRMSTALSLFESTEFEVLAVVKSRIDPRLVGCIHEADLLRCYVEEADRMRREELGGAGLFTDLAGRE
jgi:CIC family chloride channel protein